MKIKFTCLLPLVFLILVSYNFGHAQVTKNSSIKEYLSLTGDVNMLCIFVDTDTDDWEESEIEYYYNQYLESQNWIKKEAEFYGRDLKFDNDAFFVDNKRLVQLNQIKMTDRPSLTLSRIMDAPGLLQTKHRVFSIRA